MLRLRKRLSQPAASGPDASDAPRQICPPNSGLSSMIAVEIPDSAADTAAAKPAGPAPTTTSSNSRVTRLRTSAHLHAGTAKDLTTFAMGNTINRQPAFKADAHAAERTARRTQNRSPR